MSAEKFPLASTRIAEAGVMRCCLETVAEEYQTGDEMVSVGLPSKCRHCGTTFTLTPEKIWKPDWQIKQDE